MNTNDSFDRQLGGWLVAEAQGRVPDHLAEVLVTTRATRQRRGWASLERWLPVTSFTMARRTFLPRPLVPILLVVALLVAALVAVVIVQSGRSKVPPLGQALNGRIVFVDGNSIKSVTADGKDPRVISEGSEPPGEPAISPDGQLVAYTAEQNRIEILSIAAPSSRAPVDVTAPGMTYYGGAAWSPTGDQIAFVAADSTSDHVFVAQADGTNVREVAAELVEKGHIVGWPGFSPDGKWLAFAEGAPGATGRLVLVPNDGSAARAIESNLVDMGDGAGISWSPDPATSRILYYAYGGAIYYYDLKKDEDVYVGIGFWTSWSPTGDRISYWSNGTKVIATPASSAGARTPINVFPEFMDGCGDHPELAGQALCGPVTWSPDGARLIATEVTGNGLLSLRSDGSGDPLFVDLATDVGLGAGGLVAWQPMAP